MSRTFYLGLRNFLYRLENLLQIGYKGQPPTQFALAGMPSINVNARRIVAESDKPDRFSLKELLGDGIFWAVPKHRRTIEKRLKRKFGLPGYNWKPLITKTNLRTCNQCGHDHELGILCPHCYKKVELETRLMQEKIQEKLGLEPVEHEVVVLYEGEQLEGSVDAANKKNVRVVEMEKARPVWFSKNLMQKTTVQPENTKEVKPSNLG
ncbi:PREDICTED: 39S ribosomal protein L32, mitochondrial [Rhagoletis zephyria]|uniref:39S ribosomal protein L32, mitochondrial n=1 Tax=Rhagoletis zephyria TaxID=28612 RepID=UPI000811913E|nr:PREDICTED: 39S ribosomal protein L32, mitochondrial [Rhagoletis zephyria]